MFTWHWSVPNKSRQCLYWFWLINKFVWFCPAPRRLSGKDLCWSWAICPACHCVMYTWHQRGWKQHQSCKRANCDSGRSASPQEAGTQTQITAASFLSVLSLLSWKCSNWQQLQVFSCSHLLGSLRDMGLISLCRISYGQMEHGTKISLH